MARKKYELTPEHRAELRPWHEKWVKIAMRTDPQTDADREAMIEAVNGLYDAANLDRPKHIVFVPSPLVGQIASGFAAAIWYMHSNATRAATWAATEDATWDATWAATRDATRAATEDATEDATWAATRAATKDATWDATWAATRDATRAATEDATEDATWAATRAATRAATWDATWAATRDATRAATWDATEAATEDATEDATWAATRAATRDATRAATEAATWAATEAATGDATWAATRDATRAATEAATRDATRAATEAATEDATWAATRDATRAATEDATRDATLHPGWARRLAHTIAPAAVDLLCSCAGAAMSMYAGGNMWAPGVDFISFFRHIAKLAIPYSKWRYYEAAAIHAGFRFMHPKFCIVVDFPERIMIDTARRPHCQGGPSHRWRDGFEIYHWHGYRIPPENAWIITDKERITAEAIMAEPNAELRRIMCEIVEWRPLLDGAREIAQDIDGNGNPRRLLDLDIGGESQLLVEVINGSLEPDGTRRKFVLGAARRTGSRTPPRTAHEAIAASYGINPKAYREAVRT